MAIRVGVIGAGLMGSTHARILAAAVAGAEVAAIADVMHETAKRVAMRIGARAEADPDALIAAPDVDAVVIASPPATHEELTLACLRAGKPVLCEKPLAPTAEAARRVAEAEAALGRRLVTAGFMRRFDPGYLDMKARLDAGEIGAPLLVHCAHRNPSVHAGFTSETIITDSAVHEADLTRSLLGQEVVRATVLVPRPTRRAAAGVRDPLLIIFQTEHGQLADVEAFANAGYAYDIRCELVGEEGALELQAPATAAVRRGNAAALRIPASFQERFAAAYRDELQAWVAAAAAGGEPPGATAWDGYAAAAVCEAAVASLRAGGRPADVRLEPRPAPAR